MTPVLESLLGQARMLGQRMLGAKSIEGIIDQLRTSLRQCTYLPTLQYGAILLSLAMLSYLA